MHYSNIVFDIDGTLLDTETAVLRSLQDTVLHFTQKRPALEELHFALGITSEDALVQLGIQDITCAVDHWNHVMTNYAETVSLFSGIPSLLENLHHRGVRLGIVTSKTVSEFKKDFAPFGIVPYFDTVICADDTQHHKPDAEPLLKYLERSGAERVQTLYIGDSRFDCSCANAAGVDFALALWGTHEPELPARYSLQKPQELLRVLF